MSRTPAHCNERAIPAPVRGSVALAVIAAATATAVVGVVVAVVPSVAEGGAVVVVDVDVEMVVVDVAAVTGVVETMSESVPNEAPTIPPTACVDARTSDPI